MHPSSPALTAYWEHFPHEADMGVRGVGAGLEEAFMQAALALTAIITDLNLVRPQQTITVTAADPDPELLFVDFLNCLIYEMANRHMLFSQFLITIENGRLNATVSGEHVDVVRHQPAVEVKGATYTGLTVKQLDDGRWMAQCVVDV